ncbi:hypothetical protein ACVILH_001696 [Bradyrhizobium sp. USDA 4353]
MPGRVPGIHVLLGMPDDVDGRDRPGHDEVEKGERKTAIVVCKSPGRATLQPICNRPRLRPAPATRANDLLTLTAHD